MNILVTRHDKIGDFITTLPMLQALKQQTDHKIIILVSKINVTLAKELDFVDEVIEYEDCIFGLAKKIKAHNIDLSISCFIDTKIALALFLARIKTRIAPATKIAQVFFNQKVTQRRSEVKKTEWEYNFDLAKAFDESLICTPQRPFLSLNIKKPSKKRVAFHPGYGGSSDGNLTLDDYLALARSIASKNIEIFFTFGPDDLKSKEYIQKHLDFEATIYESKGTIVDFCHFLATLELFVSTSTGPMHLSGMLNIKTISFFGDNTFASPKRWATISDENLQHNFQIPKDYEKSTFNAVEKTLTSSLQEAPPSLQEA